MHGSNKLPVYPTWPQGRSGDRRLQRDRRGHRPAAGPNGAKVAVNGRDQAKIQAVVDTMHTDGGQAIEVAGDCTDVAAVDGAAPAGRAAARPGRGPSHLSSAAGGHDPGRSPRSPRRTGTRPWTAAARHLADHQQLAARHDPARPRRDCDDGLQRGPAAAAGRASAVCRRHRRGGHAHPPASELGHHGVRVNRLALHTNLTEQVQQGASEE
jgi:hypothetical protein